MPKPTNIPKKPVTTNVRSPQVRSTIQKPPTKSISQYTDTGSGGRNISTPKIVKPQTETYDLTKNINVTDTGTGSVKKPSTDNTSPYFQRQQYTDTGTGGIKKTSVDTTNPYFQRQQYTDTGTGTTTSVSNKNTDVSFNLNVSIFKNIINQSKQLESMLKDKNNIANIEKTSTEVIRGDWGNGTSRKEKLEKAGYDYDLVQSRVNDRMKGTNTFKDNYTEYYNENYKNSKSNSTTNNADTTNPYFKREQYTDTGTGGIKKPTADPTNPYFKREQYTDTGTGGIKKPTADTTNPYFKREQYTDTGTGGIKKPTADPTNPYFKREQYTDTGTGEIKKPTADTTNPYFKREQYTDTGTGGKTFTVNGRTYKITSSGAKIINESTPINSHNSTNSQSLHSGITDTNARPNTNTNTNSNTNMNVSSNTNTSTNSNMSAKANSNSNIYASIPGDERGILRGQDIEEKIWNYLKDNGYSDVDAAGIMGNMKQESWEWKYATKDSPYDSNYYGLFMSSKGYLPEYNGKDIPGQLELMNNDIKQRMSEVTNFDAFTNETNVSAATEQFMRGYERPGNGSDNHLDVRQKYANEIYERFHG